MELASGRHFEQEQRLAMRSSRRAVHGRRECRYTLYAATVPPRSLPSASCILRRSSSRRTRQLARHASTAGPFGASPPPAPGAAASGLPFDARNGRGTPRTRVARALSGSMLREGSHAPCRRRRPFGFDAIKRQVSCVCVCRASPKLSCWSGAACRFTSQSPLRLDGLRC